MKRYLSFILSFLMAFVFVFNTQIIKANDYVEVEVVRYDRNLKKQIPINYELEFIILKGFPSTEIARFKTKDGVGQAPKLDDGFYRIELEKNDYYEITDNAFEVIDGEYDFEGEGNVRYVRFLPGVTEDQVLTPVEEKKLELKDEDDNLITSELTFNVKKVIGFNKFEDKESIKSKDGSISIENLEVGDYKLELGENDYYEMERDEGYILTVEDDDYSLENGEKYITLYKKEVVLEDIEKAIPVFDENFSSVEAGIKFKIMSDIISEVTSDKNGTLNLILHEGKIYNLRLLENMKYEMDDLKFKVVKEMSFMGTTVYKLKTIDDKNIDNIKLKLKTTSAITEQKFLDVKCGSCGGIPVLRELRFKITGEDERIVSAKSGKLKYEFKSGVNYKIELLEDVFYKFEPITVEAVNERGVLKLKNSDLYFNEITVYKKDLSGACVDGLCDFSDNKISTKAIPVKARENGVIRGLNADEVIKFNLFNATRQERIGEVETVNGYLPSLEVYEKDFYILFPSSNNDKFITSDFPFEREVNEIYFRPQGDNEFPIRDKNGNPYAEGVKVTVVDEIIVRPLAQLESIKEKVSVPQFEVKFGTKYGDIHYPVTFEFKSEYDTFKATSDSRGRLNGVKMYEDIQYSIRVVNPEKLAIPNFPITIKDKSERGPNSPLGAEGKFQFDHSSCHSALTLIINEKSKINENNTTITCSTGNTIVSGMNFGDLIVKSIHTDKTHLLDNEKLEGEDFDLFRFKLINPHRCEVCKIAMGDYTIHRTLKDGKIVKKVYQLNKDNSLTELEFTQNGNVVDIKTGTLSIYDTVIVYDKPLEMDSDVFNFYKDLFNKYSNFNKNYPNLTDEGNRLAELKGALITDKITKEDMKYLKVFSVTDRNLDDKLVSPLKYATNLEEFKVILNDKNLKREVSDFSFLENLSKLKIFYYQNQAINNKNITDENRTNINETLNVINRLTNLNNIRINSTNLINLELFKNMTLETLSLQENRISDISAISTMKIKNRLDLDNNNITDVNALKNQDELVTLYLLGNPIEDIRALSDLKSLEALHLRNTNIKNIKALKELPKLHRLYIDGTKKIDKNYMEDVKTLDKINYLFVNEISLGDFNWFKEFAIRPVIDAKYNEDKIRGFYFEKIVFDYEINSSDINGEYVIIDNPLKDWNNNFVSQDTNAKTNKNIIFENDKIKVKLRDLNQTDDYDIYITNGNHTFGDYDQAAEISGTVYININIKDEPNKELVMLMLTKDSLPYTVNTEVEVLENDILVEKISFANGMGTFSDYEKDKIYSLRLSSEKLEIVTKYLKVVEKDGFYVPHLLKTVDEPVTDENLMNLIIKDRKTDLPEESETLDELKIYAQIDDVFTKDVKIRVMYWDNNIPTILKTLKTDDEGKAILNGLILNSKYEIRPFYKGHKFAEDVFVIVTDENGKIKLINDSSAKEYKDGLFFKGTKSTTITDDTVEVLIKVVNKNSNLPVENVEVTANIISTSMPQYQHVRSDKNGIVKFNLEGSDEGKIYAMTISKNDQFLWDFSPSQILVIVNKNSYTIKNTDDNKDALNIFKVTSNEKTYLKEDLRKIIEKAENLINSHKYTDETINKLKSAVEGGKRELALAQTLPYYVETHIQNIQDAIDNLKGKEVKIISGGYYEQTEDYKPIIRTSYVKNEEKTKINDKKQDVKTIKNEKQEKNNFGIAKLEKTSPIDFIDISQEEKEVVDFVSSYGIMKGISKSEFAPKNEISRAMVVQTLMRIAEDKTINNDVSFKDVNDSDWFKNAGYWGATHGYAIGDEKGNFNPNNKITRQELSLILYRFIKNNGIVLDEKLSISFNDEIPNWSKEAVLSMAKLGIVLPKTNSNYEINSFVSRYELARALKIIIESLGY